MSIDQRFALIDSDGDYRYPFKKLQRISNRYGFALGGDRKGRGEYTENIERVIQAVVFEGLGIRVKAVDKPGKAGNTLSLHAQQKIVGYWIAPELRHLVANAEYRPIDEDKFPPAPPPKSRRPTSAEDLQKQLERQSETGCAGELFVVLDELQRLRDLGCEQPESFVERVAISDVGCGYDIASTWPSHERFIEVKSTTVQGADFYLSANELNVLQSLGNKAWLYRVFIDKSGHPQILKKSNDPIRTFLPEHLTPVIFRVPECSLKNCE